MRTPKLNMLKRAVYILLPILILTACTGREDIVLELNEQGKVQEAGDVTEEDISTSEVDGNVQQMLDESPVMIYVHICGAVVNPGVYELAAGSRVFEGIEAAGGFREDACEDYVNQAKLLQDGQRLVILTLEEVEEAKENGAYQELQAADIEEAEQSTAASLGDTDGLVNINTASESELSTIDGIGVGKAAAIVKYRQENGEFKSIQDIMKVSGIKEGTFEKIKDKITVK